MLNLKERTDGSIRFHRINHTLEMAGKQHIVSVLIGEDMSGKKFYNLNPNTEEYFTKDEALRVTLQIRTERTSNKSIAYDCEDVNIIIFDAEYILETQNGIDEIFSKFPIRGY
jgi:hypothetical protein